MKTLNILNNLLNMYGEAADATIPQPDQQSPAGQPASTVPVPETPAEPEITQPLTSEGEIFLLNLIKQALTTKLSLEDSNDVNMMGEITRDNAVQMRETLVSLINGNNL